MAEVRPSEAGLDGTVTGSPLGRKGVSEIISKIQSVLVQRSSGAKSRRLVLWDALLIVAIVAVVAVLATHANPAQANKTTATANLNRGASAPEPLAGAASQANVTDLIAQLKDPSATVRDTAAQELGIKRSTEATNALLAATYDSDGRVREDAAAALGDIGAVQALPRLDELQVTQGYIYVEIAAFEAQGKVASNVAAALNVPATRIQALAVAPNGTAFAAALNRLFVLNNGAWQPVGPLPDAPNNISAGPDAQLLYLSTNTSGLYRSEDAGRAWKHVQFGQQTPTQLIVTAVVVDPTNAQRIYVALAANSSIPNEPNSLGIAVSEDGGQTFTPLPNSPNESVTTQLLIDRTTPEFLYGLSDVGPWRYQLGGTDASAQ